MFGIGGGELVFILMVVLMLFGSDKIPEIARTLGKGMAQLKNATNEVKQEIQKGMQENGLDKNSLTGGISDEIEKAKQGFTKMVNDSNAEVAVQSEIDQIRENFAKLNTDLNPEAREFNPENEVSEPAQELSPISETPETTPEPLPDEHTGTIKRQR